MERALNFILNDDDVLEEMLDFRRPRTYKERRNYFDECDDTEFITRFRLSKPSVLNVLQMIEPNLEFPSDRNQSIAPINQLLMTLRFYATGAQQLVMADFIGASKATANRIVHRVSTAIAQLSRHHIRFPGTEDEIRQTQGKFYEIARFPKVLGALDCTHVKIRSPGGGHAEFYRNRKGYMSINVQAICNANLEIIDLVARWPGSTHDQTILNASYRNLLFENGRYGDAVLLADSGYMNRPYIMTPLEVIHTAEERLYNESQARSRNKVECLFGVWKRRFPILAVGMQMALGNCLPVIVATGVLHNILRRLGEDAPPDDPELLLPAPWEALIQEGQIREQRLQRGLVQQRDINPVRRSLINNYFKTLIDRRVQ